MQKTVELFDVIDPETNEVFLKMLPSTCFPDKPDEAMEAWYEGVAARLSREAEAEANGVRVEDEPRSSADLSGEASSADEKTGAFKYFEDPMYRKARTRPTFMRHVSKEQARAGSDHGPISRVRHLLNPWSRRRSLPPGRYEDDSFSDEDATPIAPNPPSAQRQPVHKRPHPPRRESSLSTTDSDSEVEAPPSRRRTPDLRTRKSHESPVAPRDYFPAYHEQEHQAPHPLLPCTAQQRLPSSPPTSPKCKHATTTTGPPCPHERASDPCQRQTSDTQATPHPSARSTQNRPTYATTTATATATETTSTTVQTPPKRTAATPQPATRYTRASATTATATATWRAHARTTVSKTSGTIAKGTGVAIGEGMIGVESIVATEIGIGIGRGIETETDTGAGVTGMSLG